MFGALRSGHGEKALGEETGNPEFIGKHSTTLKFGSQPHSEFIRVSSIRVRVRELNKFNQVRRSKSKARLHFAKPTSKPHVHS